MVLCPGHDAEMEFPSAEAGKRYCQKKNQERMSEEEKKVPIESNKMERTKNLSK